MPQNFMRAWWQVAEAISLTTDRVEVRLLFESSYTDPGDLLDLRFNDEEVGITNEQMERFKHLLKEAGPRAEDPVDRERISESIERIPADASLTLGEVVELVRQAWSGPWLRRNQKYIRSGEGESLEFESVGDDPSDSASSGPEDDPRSAQSPEESSAPRSGRRSLPEGFTHIMPYPPLKESSRRASRGSGRSTRTSGLDRAVSSSRSKPKRVVSTGFSEQTSPGKPIGATLTLECNHDYYFWLEVGRPVKGAIDVSPQPLPEKLIPRDALLKVALFDFDHRLSITPGADVGEIKLETDGTASVVRQPVEPEGVSRQSRLFKKRLFFPVKAGNLSDDAQLRCNIYYEQVLIQSRVVKVRITRRQRSIERALSTSVDYTLSRTLNPAHVAEMEPHRLSLMLNDNGNGTHGFRFFGGEGFKNDATLSEGELKDFITQARRALSQAAWGDEDPWQQGKAYLYAGSHDPQQPRDLERLERDLLTFAIRGYRFYSTIIKQLTDSVEQSDELAKLMRTPGMIQVALKQSARHVFPAAMFYDYPLDTNAEPDTYALCPGFLQAQKNAAALEESDCFQGNCPSQDADTVVCPSGFWGYRHSLGMPLSLKNAPEAPSELAWEGKPQISVGVSTDQAFVLRSDHEKALQALQPQLAWNYADTRDTVLKLLKNSTAQLVYFYCHGGIARNVPFIQVGLPKERGITADNLRSKSIRWKSPRPLVFINGCHTAALQPDVAIDFISDFVQVAGACGVIGTEITIFEPLARAFAEECLGRFLKGERIGDAIRGARLKLLKEGNPLGLVYIPYVIASLHMSEKPAN